MASEFTLIEKYFRPLAGPEGLGLLDDAALVTPKEGEQLVVSKDILLEDVHFRAGDPPEKIAAKALGVNLSDLAAKGATPRLYFLGLALPATTAPTWIADFSAGLQATQDAHGIVLAGGDTTRSKQGICISVTVIGTVQDGAMIKRSGAKAGDAVYVTGTLGDAALGLMSLTGEIPSIAMLEERYLVPIPRVALGQALVGCVSSAADVSDGVLADLGHICKASGVSAAISLEDLPISRPASKCIADDPALLQQVYAGGDDYEIVFTAPMSARKTLEALSAHFDVKISRIGSIKEGNGVQLLDPKGNLVQAERLGYDHFS